MVTAQELSVMVDTKVIPQIAAGNDWKTIIKVFNQSSDPNTISVGFKSKLGQPLPIASGNKDQLDFILDPNGSKEVVLDRRSELQTGWARITSTGLSYVQTRFEYYGNGRFISYATIPESYPVRSFSVELDPLNGIAIVNDHPDRASLDLFIFDEEGKYVGSKALPPLAPGEQLTKFFSEEPFGLGNQKGKVEISSNLPLVVTALTFREDKFSVLPIMFALRKLDLPAVENKIGILELVPNDRQATTDLAGKVQRGMDVINPFLEKELLRHGFRSTKLLVDPKVKIVNGSKPWREYLAPNNELDWKKVSADTPATPQWPFRVVFVNAFEIKPSGEILGWMALGGSNWASTEGTAWLSSMFAHFLRPDWLNNTSLLVNQKMPEVSDFSIPFLYYVELAKTLSGASEFALHVFAHELGHAFGEGYHVGDSIFRDVKNFANLMGWWKGRGFFGEDRKSEGILSPGEAEVIGQSLAMADNGWVSADYTAPQATVTSATIESGRLHINFSASDPESSIGSLALVGKGLILHWQRVTSNEVLNSLVVDVPWPDSLQDYQDSLHLVVFNTKSGRVNIPLVLSSPSL